MPGAWAVPAEEWQPRFGWPKPKRDQEIVFYCRSGKRSASASDIARRNGFTKYVGSFGVITCTDIRVASTTTRVRGWIGCPRRARTSRDMTAGHVYQCTTTSTASDDVQTSQYGANFEDARDPRRVRTRSRVLSPNLLLLASSSASFVMFSRQVARSASRHFASHVARACTAPLCIHTARQLVASSSAHARAQILSPRRHYATPPPQVVLRSLASPCSFTLDRN